MKYLVLFAQRINLLRTAHSLSLADVSLFLNLKSNVVPSKWERQKNWASCETLIAISRLFGVSLDWLMGSSDEIYQDAFVLERERTLIKSRTKESWVNVCYELDLPVALFNEYFNEGKRIENYTLPVRAKIIFLLNIVLAFIDAKNDDISVDDMEYCKMLKQPEVYDEKINLKVDCYGQLKALIASNDLLKPLYDVNLLKD